MGERDRGAMQKKKEKKKAGAKTVRQRGRGRERSNIVDMDSTTVKAAGWEWANGKPPALYGVSCNHVVSPHLNLQNSKREEMRGAKGDGRGEVGGEERDGKQVRKRQKENVKKKEKKTNYKERTQV